MKISMAEVFEVATFYAHFTIIDEKDEEIPEVTIRVCESLTCELFGGQDLYEEVKKKFSNKARVLQAPCMGKCDFAPTLEIGHNHINNANLKKVEKALLKKSFAPEKYKFISLDNYIGSGGYKIYKNIVE